MARKFGSELIYKGRERELWKEGSVLYIRTDHHKKQFILQYTVSLTPYEQPIAPDVLLDKVWYFLKGEYQELMTDTRKGELITLEEYLLSEGENGRKSLEALKKELKVRKISSYRLFGNRIEAEYYDGCLILNDDIRFLKTNVVSFK